jgi:hypothetical protein
MADYPPLVVVSAAEASRIPYPFVYVNVDGTVRELHAKEREYLETPFHPCDGGRPYTKQSYADKNGWGEIIGFCERSKIPPHLAVAPAPEDDPGELWRAMMEALNTHCDHPCFVRFQRIVYSAIEGNTEASEAGLHPATDSAVASPRRMYGSFAAGGSSGRGDRRGTASPVP